MYRKTEVDIPEAPGRIVLAKISGTTYVYYQTARSYSPEKKYSSASRVVIGKVSSSSERKMFPNERYYELFPETMTYSDCDSEATRSCALKIGPYVVIKKLIDDLKIQDALSSEFPEDDRNMILDLASYSMVTENNAAQYYPMYAFEHAIFTSDMKIYSDSTISRWLHTVTPTKIVSCVNNWNSNKILKDHIYISYDATNKNSQAGDVDFVEYGEAKIDVGLPIINYSLAYDITDKEPLFYESYPGSIPDVAQLKYMVDKAKGYGYSGIGFMLDRGFFSKTNIEHMDENGYDFVIMVKGRKKLVRSIIEEKYHTFEKKSSCYIEEYGVFGCTVEKPLFEKDKKNRYIHLYHNSSKEAAELIQLNDNLRKMKKEMDKMIGTNAKFPKSYLKYFELFYSEQTKTSKDKDGKDVTTSQRVFSGYQEKEDYVEQERNLCGYFAIATSAKMTAREALILYKSRDSSEKLFRGDKSYLGNKSLRTHTTEPTEAKIFIEFIALIIRSRMYNKLNEYNLSLDSKLNFLTVPAAMKELEKIVVIKLPDGQYRLSYALTKTQKIILSALGLTDKDVFEEVKAISKQLSSQQAIEPVKCS